MPEKKEFSISSFFFCIIIYISIKEREKERKMEEMKHIGFRIIKLLNYYIKFLKEEKMEKYVLRERTFLTFLFSSFFFCIIIIYKYQRKKEGKMEEMKHIGFRIILLNYYIESLRGNKIEKYVLQERTFLTCFFFIRTLYNDLEELEKLFVFLFFIFHCVE